MWAAIGVMQLFHGAELVKSEWQTAVTRPPLAKNHRAAEKDTNQEGDEGHDRQRDEANAEGERQVEYSFGTRDPLKLRSCHARILS